jgi:mRNA interferase RelE/StbE
MKYSIVYHSDVLKEDITRLSGVVKLRIKKNIEEKLVNNPNVFGKHLRNSLKGYWKLRVGDHRIIFQIKNKTVKIFIIQHRREVYKKIIGRI